MSQKSGNEMSVEFGRDVDDEIGMNPSITIIIPRPKVTSTWQGCFIIFNYIKRIQDLAYRRLQWDGEAKSESENLV